MTRSPPTEPDTPSNLVTMAVVETVAAYRDVDPSSLEPPLHDVIDTDALETLFGPTRRGSRSAIVTFEYDDMEITVDAHGTVDVEGLE